MNTIRAIASNVDVSDFVWTEQPSTDISMSVEDMKGFGD